MNISTAEFDWISLLFLAGAGIIGMIKARQGGQKKMVKDIFTPDLPDSYEEEEDEIPEYRKNVQEVTEERWRTETLVEEPVPTTDYYREIVPESGLSKNFTEEETEEEVHPHFDIRQAVISSEILKRPQY